MNLNYNIDITQDENKWLVKLKINSLFPLKSENKCSSIREALIACINDIKKYQIHEEIDPYVKNTISILENML